MRASALFFMMDDRERERILWRCRRGLLELDLLLQQFIQKHFAQLTDAELASFAHLLELPDPDLLDCCNGVTQLDDPQQQALVHRIAKQS